ncbi:MAG: CBS domain-containing protein [Chryseolinea sp.]
MHETMEVVLLGYSRFPVFENSLDEIVGIVHAKDIIAAYVQKADKSLKEIMRPAHFIPESKRIDVLLREFQRRKSQMAIVVSEFGGTIGIVTLEDILEELVGEIQDEHDHEQQIVTLLDKQDYQIVAQSSIHDINKFVDVPFPESEDYETLSGLLTYHRPTLKEGDTFKLFNYRFKILRLNKTLPELVEATLEEEVGTD